MYEDANKQSEKTLEFAQNNSLPELEMRSLSLLEDLQQAVTTDKRLLYDSKLLELAEVNND
ncbi:hypothetical protein APR41_17590 [Salegentibacter salinarum]|uniref:Uncharacterized protein n=1 Tax=Salegentibacter salinarum TaxID=447422 RepID=A0A2N0TVS1_9FLAO|nr:hypothetical protein APR41_17590 [Salegentibacter salinarum]